MATGRAAAAVCACALLLACTSGSTAQPTTDAQPGLAWATFIRDDCEWSAPQTPPAVCFGNRGQGFLVRAVRPEGSRWYVWDPTTQNFAYVDRAALSLPAEVTVESAPPQRTKAVVACVDRSRHYRYTAQARAALAVWLQGTAQPGDVYYLRWIEENSYQPAAEAVPAIRVPLLGTPVPMQPTAPVPNPFSGDQVAHATATTSAQQTAQVAAAATHEAQGRATAAAVRRQLDAFQQLQVGAAASADVGGCVRKAAELLADAPQDRYLVIASSGVGPDVTGVALDRVQLRLVFLQCNDAAECDNVKEAWRALAASSNAANLRFGDPSQGLTDLEPRP